MQVLVTEHAEVYVRDLLAAGDSATFGRIYSRNKQRVYKVAYRLLKCHETAREVVKEVFSTIWIKRDRFREVDSLEAFIYTMAKNRSLVHLERQKKDQRFLFEFSDHRTVPTPHALLEDRETYEVFVDILNRLTDRQREVFRMLREEQKSHLEMALALNISTNTVNNHIKACLEVLRASLEGRKFA